MKIIICLIFVALGVVSSEVCNDSKVWPETSDALQYNPKTWLWNKDYHEWWFFTFFDEKSEIGMAFSYGLSDPQSKTNATCGISNMVWTKVLQNNSESSVPEIFNYYHPMEQCTFSQANADVSMPRGNISVSEDGKTYSIKMDSPDQRLNVDLEYTQLVNCARQVEDFEPIVLLAWQSYMPSAKVVGTIVYNGTTYEINQGKGYHDKNWGAWPSSLFNWIWAQYEDHEKGLGIVLGSYDVPIVEDYIGYLFLRIENNSTSIQKKLGNLCEDTWELKVKAWGTDPKGKKYAKHIYLAVEEFSKEGIMVEMDIKTVVGYENPGGQALDLEVFEMISHYDVTVHNGTEVLLQSSGYGFNEWSNIIIFE